MMHTYLALYITHQFKISTGKQVDVYFVNIIRKFVLK